MGLLKRLRGAAIDLSPLRIPDFRRLWTGQAISAIGTQLTVVGVPYQVFQLTHSSLAVGVVALVELAPWLIAGVVGGALADQMDRRRLMLAGDGIMAVGSGVLALNALMPHPNLILIYAVLFLVAAPAAVHRTAMRSGIPRIVGLEHMVQAGALENVYYQTSAIGGPALAGLVIAVAGLPLAYVLDAVTFLVAAGMIFRIAPMPPIHDIEKLSVGMIVDGFRYVVHSPVVFSSQLVDFSAMFFGMPNALFPALADRIGGGAGTLGLLFAAPAAGSLLLAVFSRPFVRIRRQGIGLLCAVGAWGVAIAGLGLSPWLWGDLAALAVAGAADAVSGMYRTAMVQTVTPDSMRGRLSGVELVFYSTGPILGDFEAGLVGALWSVPGAIVSGGVASLVGALLVVLRFPELVRYDAGVALHSARLESSEPPA